MNQPQSTKPQAPAATENTAAAPASTEPVRKDITKLPDNANPALVIAKINELVDRANNKRDRGPDSTRKMTLEDAERIMIGDLKEVGHTEVANMLGLSYGQVYSSRKGFTFKATYQKSAKTW